MLPILYAASLLDISSATVLCYIISYVPFKCSVGQVIIPKTIEILHIILDLRESHNHGLHVRTILCGPGPKDLHLTKLKSNRCLARRETDNQIILPRGRGKNVFWTGGKAIEAVPGEAEPITRLRCHIQRLLFYPYMAPREGQAITAAIIMTSFYIICYTI